MTWSLRARLYAWLTGINLPPAEDLRGVQREATIDELSSVDALEAAINTVAAAMPNGNGRQMNGPIFDDIESRKEMLRHMIDGRSAIYAVDWAIHPTHCVLATTQPDGRALLTIHHRDEFLQKGSQ